MSILADKIINELIALGDPDRAQHTQRFFKTGKGEYGEGDIFLGIKVPRQHALAKKYKRATRQDALDLLHSKYHEVRLTALFLLVNLYNQADAAGKHQIYNDYLYNMQYINNWDLVDISAGNIVGAYLYEKDRVPLYRFVKSQNLWERRISIISTFHFIRNYDFDDTLKIAEILLNDKEDLIHKAVGWMLREVGKRELKIEEEFLQEHYQEMPRTMLRYATERITDARRKMYLKGQI